MVENSPEPYLQDIVDAIEHIRRKMRDVSSERLPDPRGDRVKLEMSGKFLRYRYYGAQQGCPELGYKEE